MNFIERFAHLSNLPATVLEINPNKFVTLPEGAVSWSVQDGHTVVWYRDGSGTHFAQIGQVDYLTYPQMFAALVPIDVPRGESIGQDLMAVLEIAPDDVLAQFADWAKDFDPERYPNQREVCRWLNSKFGVSFAAS